MKDLVWNVFIYDFNENKIKTYNIFYKGFLEDFKKYLINETSCKNAIKKWAKYNYWSKSEYEIFICGNSKKENNFKKIDIYNQIEINLDRITEYVIENLIKNK